MKPVDATGGGRHAMGAWSKTNGRTTQVTKPRRHRQPMWNNARLRLVKLVPLAVSRSAARAQRRSRRPLSPARGATHVAGR